MLEAILEARGVHEFEWKKRRSVRIQRTPLVAGEAHTQEAIAAAWGVSQSMIYQIEQRALGKLRLAIRREARIAGQTPAEWLAECFL